MSKFEVIRLSCVQIVETTIPDTRLGKLNTLHPLHRVKTKSIPIFFIGGPPIPPPPAAHPTPCTGHLGFYWCKNVMEGRGGKEGREGGDQARFLMWIANSISCMYIQTHSLETREPIAVLGFSILNVASVWCIYIQRRHIGPVKCLNKQIEHKMFKFHKLGDKFYETTNVTARCWLLAEMQ